MTTATKAASSARPQNAVGRAAGGKPDAERRANQHRSAGRAAKPPAGRGAGGGYGAFPAGTELIDDLHGIRTQANIGTAFSKRSETPMARRNPDRNSPASAGRDDFPAPPGRNNNRPWFEAHRPDYERRGPGQPLRALVEEMDVRWPGSLRRWWAIRGDRCSGSTRRPLLPDKSPYKTHASCCSITGTPTGRSPGGGPRKRRLLLPAVTRRSVTLAADLDAPRGSLAGSGTPCRRPARVRGGRRGARGAAPLRPARR